ncbi:MAG TPA: hypothetical protein VFR90_15900 [Methylibium sp.]|uniref:hypothetical protein n=1 Tax=Methylibium sp. TaxID=2067992 RepID=UPI002DBDCEC8|nr:hypothetical protein [Methylibium sp.]HEU4460604.1 hypothetical protein [Methylibium sp.]
MLIVLIAWLYVAVLMAAAEAMSPQGTLLGAFFTLLLYGLGPIAIVMYLMGTPARRRARKRAESAREADAGGEPAAAAVAAEREEP